MRVPAPVILINGDPVDPAGTHSQTTLLDLLRARGLTGAKEGCAEGECGACTVVMVTPRGTGSAYTPVNSCLMFAPAAAGREFLTVEALAQQDGPCEVQQAMAAAGGSQCGYCTPGFVMSLFAEQYRAGREGPCDPHALSGNLCRCTGYRPIRDAALSVGPAPAGAFLDRLSEPVLPLTEVSIPGFARPTSLAAALAEPNAKWIAGATDLAVESNLRFRRWDRLVSLEAIPELREYREDDDAFLIGAALPLSEIPGPPELRAWAELFASPPIRNRATLGGNLATASPIGDSAPLLLSLNASLRIVGPAGERVVTLDRFFTGYRQTQLAPGELIRSVEVPKPLPALSRFYKAAKRRMDDISTVAAGFSLDIGPDRRIESARFAFGGVAATPLRAHEAEAAAEGQPWDHGAVTRIQRVLDGTLKPIGDHRGSAEYRSAVAQSLVAKFLEETR